MSDSNSYFLTCIQISQEASQMVFPSLEEFSTACGDPHSQKLWHNKAEVDFFFWNSLAFSMIQQILAIWSLVPLPFLNPIWTFGSSQFTYYWNLAWRILSITYFASMWDECNCAVVWAFFGTAFLWEWNENWPFPDMCPLLSFPVQPVVLSQLETGEKGPAC